MRVPTPREKTTICTEINTIYAESLKELAEKVKEEFGRDLSEVKYIKQRGVKIGKNSSCPCDSGKLYKRCCISKKTESSSYLIYVAEEILEEDSKLEQQREGDSQNREEMEKILKRLKKTVDPRDLKENYVQDDCPICSKPACSWTGSVWKDRLCENKHVWHTCKVHGTVVIGPPNYNLSSDICSCNKD